MIEIHWLFIPIIIWVLIWAFGVVTDQHDDGDGVYAAVFGFVSIACLIIYGWKFFEFLINNVRIVS